LNPLPKTPLKTTLLGVKAYELSLYASTHVPSLLPTITRRHFDRFFSQDVKGIDNSVDVFNFDCLFKQFVTEWAIDW
jgi:L-gulonolactone oxidase